MRKKYIIDFKQNNEILCDVVWGLNEDDARALFSQVRKNVEILKVEHAHFPSWIEDKFNS